MLEEILTDINVQLKRIADANEAVLNTQVANVTSPVAEAEKKPAPKKDAAKKEATKPAPKKEEAKAADGPTIDDVRAVMLKVNNADATRELIEDHGGKKLSDIDPSKFAALISDAEALLEGNDADPLA